MVKNLPSPAVQETQVQSLSWKDPLEKGMATHSSILAPRPHSGKLAQGKRAPDPRQTCLVLGPKDKDFSGQAGGPKARDAE